MMNASHKMAIRNIMAEREINEPSEEVIFHIVR